MTPMMTMTIPRLRDLRSPASTQRLSLGCPHLDALLGGGIPVGCLTEVVGEATAGKTQLCLRLLLNAQLPEDRGGLDGCSLWLCSEKGDPPVRRLAQLASTSSSFSSPLSSSTSTPSLSSSSSLRPSDPSRPSTDNVYVEKGIATPQELVEVLDRMEPLMAASASDVWAHGGARERKKNKKRVRLVVVDSIAALFRDAASAVATVAAEGEQGFSADAAANGNGNGDGNGNSYGNGNGNNSGRVVYAARASALFAVAARLRRLADDHALAVGGVNQVTDVVGADEGHSSAPFPPPMASTSFAMHQRLQQHQQRAPPTHTAGLRLVSSGREVAPALGLAWASCVGMRLFLSRAVPVGSSFIGGEDIGTGATGASAMTTATTTAKPTKAATRCLQVVFAPHLPPSYCLATVDERGLVGVAVEEKEEMVEEEEAKKRRALLFLQQQQKQQQPRAAGIVDVVCSGVFADGEDEF